MHISVCLHVFLGYFQLLVICSSCELNILSASHTSLKLRWSKPTFSMEAAGLSLFVALALVSLVNSQNALQSLIGTGNIPGNNVPISTNRQVNRSINRKPIVRSSKYIQLIIYLLLPRSSQCIFFITLLSSTALEAGRQAKVFEFVDWNLFSYQI